MKYKITLNSFKMIDELPDYWSEADFRNLLEAFEYPDATEVAEEELRDMLFMAMTDFEPEEAAEKLLHYKLGDQLSEGQIQQLSHEMIEDKVAEEYPDIALHGTLFHINQLLFKAFNGRFPNTKATIIEFSMLPQTKERLTKVTKKQVLTAFDASFSERNIIKRLFSDQMAAETTFAEAEHILWEFQELKEDQYRLLTSEYWIVEEDFTSKEFECSLTEL